MPQPPKETVCIPQFGKWNWNNETKNLELTCSNSSVKIKAKRKTSSYQEHIRKHLERISKCQQSAKEESSGLRKMVGPAELKAYSARVKHSQGDLVTIGDIKLTQDKLFNGMGYYKAFNKLRSCVTEVAASLVHGKEGLPIPKCFMKVIQARELDNFLTGLLLYLDCHWQRKSLGQQPMPLMVEQSVTKNQMMAEANAKVELAKMHMASCYSSLVLGTGLSHQHHMACGRSRVSSTYRDRQLYECLYSFFIYVAWVTFERQGLKEIQAEIGTLLRSDTFNPALRAQNEEEELQESSKTKSQSEAENRRSVTNIRKSQLRPALRSALAQRSPLLVSLLPSTREKSSYLFQSLSFHNKTDEPMDTDVLMEELTQQLASCSFGILGQPLSQFSYSTLMPHGAKKDDAEADDGDSDLEEDEKNPGRRASITAQRSSTRAAGKSSGLSRARTVTSRATTEALSSDTE